MSVRLVCIDLDGTLTEGLLGSPIAGAAEALARIRRALPVRIVTNSTSIAHRRLFEHARAHGLCDDPSTLVTPLTAARALLPGRGHDRGILLAEPETRRELSWFREDPDGPAVLLAGEVQSLRVADLQPAFRCLLAGAAFYSVQRNRYFRRGGELVTDAGPLVAFFEYAAGAKVTVLGKPSPAVFDDLAAAAGVSREALCMVGDDAEFDASASVALGMQGVLVRTGKYRPGDEERCTPRPSAVLPSIASLPDWLGVP